MAISFRPALVRRRSSMARAPFLPPQPPQSARPRLHYARAPPKPLWPPAELRHRRWTATTTGLVRNSLSPSPTPPPGLPHLAYATPWLHIASGICCSPAPNRLHAMGSGQPAIEAIPPAPRPPVPPPTSHPYRSGERPTTLKDAGRYEFWWGPRTAASRATSSPALSQGRLLPLSTAHTTALHSSTTTAPHCPPQQQNNSSPPSSRAAQQQLPTALHSSSSPPSVTEGQRYCSVTALLQPQQQQLPTELHHAAPPRWWWRSSEASRVAINCCNGASDRGSQSSDVAPPA